MQFTDEDHDAVCSALSAALGILAIAEQSLDRGVAVEYWLSTVEGTRSDVLAVERLTPGEYWRQYSCSLDKLTAFSLRSWRILARHQKPANDNGQVFEA